MKYFPGNIFENSISFAVSDMIAYTISGSILKVTNTSRTLMLSYSVSIVGGTLYLIFHQKESLIPIFIILSRVGNAMSFNTVYVTNNKLFPTKFVATTYGIANLVSHTLAVGAPLVSEI